MRLKLRWRRRNARGRLRPDAARRAAPPLRARRGDRRRRRRAQRRHRRSWARHHPPHRERPKPWRRRQASSPIATWLAATVDWGTATRLPTWPTEARHSPVARLGRRDPPADQGAQLTALGDRARSRGARHGDRRQRRRPTTQHGMVDHGIVGTDRTTADGDACNKIGTYRKALAATDMGVPSTSRGHRRRSTGRSAMAWKEILIEDAGGRRSAFVQGRARPRRDPPRSAATA